MNNKPKKFFLITSIIWGLFLVAFSVPLIKEMVGPNGYYGFIMDQSTVSGEAWYEINRYGGYALLLSAIVFVTCNILLYYLGRNMVNKKYILLFFIILMLCILMATALTVSYAKEMEIFLGR